MQDVTVAWEHARAQFPDFDVPEDVFRNYLGRYSTPSVPGHAHEEPEKPVNPLTVITDLYLACACARGNTRAIASFRARYLAVVERVRLRFGKRAPAVDELWSELAGRLFVASAGKAAKIEEYSGRSELSAWLRVVVLRLILNRLEAEKPEVPFEDRLLEGLRVTEASPEMALGRAEHRSEVREALARATAQLSVRERRILRLAFAEGFTIDDLGALYNVHRATAARWIKEAVTKLGALLRRGVRADLGLSPSEYESWARAVASSMDVSVAKYLASETPPSES